ncbi:MAG: GntR family transcriptional regulator [Microbacterium sp.]
MQTRLRDAILSGEMRPNQRIVEADLAEDLGVSRTPVREALLRRRHDGLVAQRKGRIVRDHDSAEVLEHLEARAALESVTAGFAAERISDETLGRLRELSRREVNALNSQFHRLIAEAGGDPVLAAFARDTDINYWTFTTPIIFTADDERHVDNGHRALLDALQRHDAEAAATIAREHVMGTAQIIARSLGLSQR